MLKKILLSVFISAFASLNAQTSISQPELTVYAAPDGAPVNNTYSVYVRYEGGEWIDLHEYDVPVDGDEQIFVPKGRMSFVYFDSDFSKRIDVRVIKNSGSFSTVEIRPYSAGITPNVLENTVEFSLTESKKLSVEFDGDLLNNLAIFANENEENKPAPEDVTYYYGPGVHLIGDGTGVLRLESNESVYIAGGAIVYGHIAVKDIEGSYNMINNVSIKGRGILSADKENSHAYNHPDHSSTPALINLNIADNVNIEGIILHNSVTWNIHMNFGYNVTVRDVKIMSWAINSDGIDPQSSQHILIDNCFVRNYDDGTSVKLNWYLGNNIVDVYNPANSIVGDITIQNSIYWTDHGRAILLGPELASNVANQVLENVTVKNIDILYAENYDYADNEWAKGVLAINDGDGAIVRNVVFEDVRVEKLGEATNLFTFNLAKEDGSPFIFSGSEGSGIQNIAINNVTCHETPGLPNYIHGFDDNKKIDGIYFHDLMINGTLIENAQHGNFDINEFTHNIKFTTSNQTEIAHWRFNNDLIDDWAVAHGNSQGTTTFSTTAIEGGNSVVFDGSNYIVTSDDVLINRLPEFTVAFWMLNIKSPESYQTLISKDGEFRLLIGSDKKLNFTVATDNIEWYGAGSNLVSNKEINAGDVVHVTAVYDGLTTKIYLNGELDIENTASVTGLTKDANGFLTIGDGATEKFQGQFDDMILFNVGLSDGEVKDLYDFYGVTTSYKKDIEFIDEIRLFPNPVKDRVVLENVTKGSVVQILSISGNILFKAIADNQKLLINTSNLENGLYLMSVENGNMKVVKKFVVSK